MGSSITAAATTSANRRDQLVDELIAFRQSFPGTRLVVNGVEAAAGTLVVSIHHATAGATIAGLPLTMEASAGGYEVLRVRNGEVSERWSGGLPDIQAQSFDDASFTMGATSGSSIRLDRIELPASGMITLPLQGQSVVMVESGQLRILRRWMDSNGDAHSDELRLDTGQVAALPAGAQIKLEPDSDNTVRLLRFSMQHVMVGAPTPPTVTEGATTELLWLSNTSALASGKWIVSTGQIHLPAGAGSTLGMPEGSRLLLCSDDGSAVLSTNKGEVFELDKQFWPSSLGSAGSIESGKAASVEGGESLDLRSESGATVGILAITPEDVMVQTAKHSRLRQRSNGATSVARRPIPARGVMFRGPARCTS